jgi:CO/xanthine dehydrogenase Mo-binding subunit
MRLDRPVKWVATRSENYQAGAHGRDHRTTAAVVNAVVDALAPRGVEHVDMPQTAETVRRAANRDG